jgi:hypothetical protein
MKKGLFLASLFFLLVVLAVLAPIAPLYQPVPARDQGVYLYVGQQILDGGIPYRDVWDHKGPLVYYINALGLWMTDSIWGVWFLEVIFLLGAAIAGFLALQMVFDSATAFASTILWLVSLPQVLDHGNTVEEYSLLFQFAAIYFYLRSEKNSKQFWNEIMVGIMAAMAFSLRPNNIGVPVAIGLVLLVVAFFSPKERAHTFKRIAAMVLGSAIVFSMIGIYFVANKSLGYLFDAVFVFNYYYSRAKMFLWESFTKGYTSLIFLVPLGMAGLVGLISCLYEYWKQGRKESDLMKICFALFALMVVPIQLYLSLLSGRRYLHYYVAWLPVLAILTAFLISWVQQLAGKIFADIRYRNILNFLIASGLILAFGIKPVIERMPPLNNLFETIRLNKSLPKPDYSAVEQGMYVEYILSHTQPGDYVLIWGNASVYNFLAERKSPSRFVYTYAFGVPNYISQEMVDELMFDITQKKPLILDATAEDRTIERIDSDMWSDIPVTQGLIRFIEENYVHVDTVGPHRFRVWVYKGNQ